MKLEKDLNKIKKFYFLMPYHNSHIQLESYNNIITIN